MTKYSILFSLLFLLGAGQVEAQKTLSEAQKIEKIIQYVEHLDGCKFIRNGTEYEPKDAAEHLRLKWKKGGKENMTAKDFIDKLASQSSMSGKPYQVKWKDGKVYVIKPFLVRELARIENQ